MPYALDGSAGSTAADHSSTATAASTNPPNASRPKPIGPRFRFGAEALSASTNCFAQRQPCVGSGASGADTETLDGRRHAVFRTHSAAGLQRGSPLDDVSSALLPLLEELKAALLMRKGASLLEMRKNEPPREEIQLKFATLLT
eukprot:1731619-Rhodomonas_salina.2